MNKNRIGIIGGSSLLNCTELNSKFEKVIVETTCGSVEVFVGKWQNRGFFVFCQRHQASTSPDKKYVQPNNINFKAITLAFQKYECTEIYGIYSVGSLNPAISIGQLIVPEDYFSPFFIQNHSDGYEAHVVPTLCMKLRQKIQLAVPTVYTGGVYVQSKGPRFETKAEIRFFKQFGDYIGMTGGHEAELFNELRIPFCMLGIVDNMANGIVPEEELKLEEFKKSQKINSERMEKAVIQLMDYLIN